MSDEAGSVSVSILGNLKPFEESLRAAELRAEAFVKNVEGRMASIGRSLSGSATAANKGAASLGIDEAGVARATQLQRSLTKELAKEGNAQAAETKRVLRQQERDQQESIDKQIRMRRSLAREMKRAADEEAAANRIAAAQSAGAQMSAGQRRNIAANMSYQLNDIISGIAMGQSPGMLLAQQGGQIFQGVQQGGGLKNTLSILGETFGKLINPVTLAIGGIGLLAVVAGKTAYDFSTMMRGLNNSTQLTGRGSGVTGGQLYNIAQKGAAAGDLSTREGASVAGIFANSGIDGTLIEGLTSKVRKYALATGQEVPDAAKELAAAVSGGANGFNDLEKRLGAFDAATHQNIASLDAQGNKLGAQAAIAREFADVMERAQIQVNGLANGWNKIGNAISNTSGKIGKGVSELIFGMDEAEKLEAKKARLVELQSRSSVSTGIDTALDTVFGDTTSAKVVDGLKAEIAELERRKKASEDAAESEKKRVDQGALSNKAKASITSIFGDMGKGVADTEKMLKTLESSEGAAKALGDQYGNLASAVRAYGDAAKTAMSITDQSIAQGKAAVQSILARTEAEKIAAAQAALDNAAAGNPQLQARLAQDKINAANSIRASGQASSADALRAANDNAATAGLAGLPKTLADINRQYAESIKNAKGNEEALRSLAAAHALNIAAATKSAEAGPIREGTIAINEQISATRIQAATFGASAGAVAEATKRQELYNQFAREGVQITPELAAGIEKIASASGHATQAQNDLTESQKKLIDTADSIRDASGGFLKTFLGDLAKGKSLVDALKNALSSLMNKLLDRIENSFLDQLLGKSGTAMGGSGDKSILGGFLGKALGISGSGEGEKGGILGKIFGSAEKKATIDDILQSDTSSSPVSILPSGAVSKAAKSLNLGSSPVEPGQPMLPDVFEPADRISQAWDQKFPNPFEYEAPKYGGAKAPSLLKQNPINNRVEDGFDMTKNLPSLDTSKLTGASSALDTLTSNAASSASNLGELGTGATAVTSALTGAGGAGASGGGGLISGIMKIFGFADGGIMSSSGPVSLRKYADGGIASSPQLAMFGEGAGPEAFVPLKNGGIPVHISGPKSTGRGSFMQSNITIGGSSIVIQGNADEKTLDAVRQELDVRDARIAKQGARNFGANQREYSALRGR